MKKWALCLLVFFVVVSTTSIHSQVAVIINLGNNISNISRDDLKSIYLGEQTEWQNGEEILLTDSKETNSPSSRLYKMLTGMNQNKIRKLWLKKVLMGDITSPESLKNDEKIIEFVSQNQGAIAIIDHKNVTKNIKILKIKGKVPTKDGYILN